MADPTSALMTSLGDLVASSKKRQAALKKAAKAAPRADVKDSVSAKGKSAAQNTAAKAKKLREANASKRRGKAPASDKAVSKKTASSGRDKAPFQTGGKTGGKKGKPLPAAEAAAARSAKAQAVADKKAKLKKNTPKARQAAGTPSKQGKAKGLNVTAKTPKDVVKRKRAAKGKSLTATALSGGGVFDAASIGSAAPNIRISIGSGAAPGGRAKGVLGVKQGSLLRAAVAQGQRARDRITAARRNGQESRRRAAGIVKPGRDVPASAAAAPARRGKQRLVQPAIRKL